MTMTETYQPADLGTCDAEPIHIIGRVQSFGYLIALSSDWFITHLSANCVEVFGHKVETLVGLGAGEVISSTALHEIRSRLQMLGDYDAVDRVFGIDLTGNGRRFDIAIYMTERTFVLEFEPAAEGRRRDYLGFVRPMTARLRTATTVAQLCQLAARQMRGLTGFDRVMIYRFAADGSGDVIAESLRSTMDSFKGLRFPATDIPQQARRLYARNMLRIIADTSDPTVPIVPSHNPQGQPLDLSMSGIRAVSPIHIEYLRNMGVRASMSVSIMRGGRLWGLIACHHDTPLTLNYAIRTAAELFGEFMAFILEQLEMRQVEQRQATMLRLHDRVMGRVAGGTTLFEAFDELAEAIGEVIPFDAMAGWIGGELACKGRIPDREQFLELTRFLSTTPPGQVWHTDNLSAQFPPAAAYRDIAAGLLVVPVSRQQRDFLLFFRSEQALSVYWAGNPEKAVEEAPDGQRLTPRKSFALWKDERVGAAEAWSEEDVRSAESLRITLLEVILRLTDAVETERMQANRRQNVLIAELNHRVRNLLNLVKSLVVQSQDGAESVEQFATVVGDRIFALARAHDQLTTSDRAPASVEQLIRTECRAYIAGDTHRVSVTGIDALVEPAAFSSLALVIHELMTNSRKYGALSMLSGHVDVTLTRQDDDDLVLSWTERGGPTVNPPTRRGFGSSIIEYSVPHELGGTANIDYDPAGLIARFTIPARHVSAFAELSLSNFSRPQGASPAQVEKPLSGTALVVEDNMIIAMEAEDIVESLGAERCVVASSVAGALELIAREAPVFALLDVNLGDETSAAIAEELRWIGTPYVIATGYGDDRGDNPALSDAPFVTKPYTRLQVNTAIVAALARRS